MAKKSKKKNPVPKRIAGVKISREWRKAAEPVVRFANNPLVADTIAAALLAGATAIAQSKSRAGAAKAAGAGAGAAAVKATNGANRIGIAVAVAATEIAGHAIAAYEQNGGDEKMVKAAKFVRDKVAVATESLKATQQR